MMAAATGPSEVTAATEHSANVVYINIDWKASRHNEKAFARNMQKLRLTIGSVVQNMSPTKICMCEVGEATRPLSSRQMQEVADWSKLS